MEASTEATPTVPGDEESKGSGIIRRILDAVLVPVLAVFTALVIGGIIIVITDAAVYEAFREGGLTAGLAAAWNSMATAYGALFSGSLGDAQAISESLVASTPFIFAGLAVAFGFRGGLFNIGAEGQLLVAAGVAVVIGFSSPGEFFMGLSSLFYYLGILLALILPIVIIFMIVSIFRDGLPRNALKNLGIYVGIIIVLFVLFALAAAIAPLVPTGWSAWLHLPLAIIGGVLGGAIYGAVPGYLKARTGAHEVINTIMMNWIAIFFFKWAFTGPLRRAGGDRPVTDEILPSAYLPHLFEGYRLHWGFFLALAVAFGVWWLLFKSTLGFEIRMVGANPNAARYGGIKIGRILVLTMAISGALAGMAGVGELLGLNHYLAEGFSPGFGFDAIALALLGKSHPLGVVLAALLFGTLRNGATRMQSIASVPIDIISIVQALVIVFIAAPDIVRWIYRVKVKTEGEGTVFTRGWGA